MTLSIVSTLDMATVTTALSSAQLAVPKRRRKRLKTSSKLQHNHSSSHIRCMYSQLPNAKPHSKEKDALAWVHSTPEKDGRKELAHANFTEI